MMVGPQCGGFVSVTQVSHLIPSYINNSAEKRTGRSHVCRNGSDRSLKIILCTFKNPFAISWFSSEQRTNMEPVNSSWGQWDYLLLFDLRLNSKIAMIENNGYNTESRIPFNECSTFCIPTVFIVIKHHAICHTCAWLSYRFKTNEMGVIVP